MKRRRVRVAPPPPPPSASLIECLVPDMHRLIVWHAVDRTVAGVGLPARPLHEWLVPVETVATPARLRNANPHDKKRIFELLNKFSASLCIEKNPQDVVQVHGTVDLSPYFLQDYGKAVLASARKHFATLMALRATCRAFHSIVESMWPSIWNEYGFLGLVIEMQKTVPPYSNMSWFPKQRTYSNNLAMMRTVYDKLRCPPKPPAATNNYIPLCRTSVLVLFNRQWKRQRKSPAIEFRLLRLTEKLQNKLKRYHDTVKKRGGDWRAAYQDNKPLFPGWSLAADRNDEPVYVRIVEVDLRTNEVFHMFTSLHYDATKREYAFDAAHPHRRLLRIVKHDGTTPAPTKLKLARVQSEWRAYKEGLMEFTRMLKYLHAQFH